MFRKFFVENHAKLFYALSSKGKYEITIVAKNISAVSKNMEIVIAKENAGSNLEKAKKWDVSNPYGSMIFEISVVNICKIGKNAVGSVAHLGVAHIL